MIELIEKNKNKSKYKFYFGTCNGAEIKQFLMLDKVNDTFILSLEDFTYYKFLCYDIKYDIDIVKEILKYSKISKNNFVIFGERVSHGKKYRLVADKYSVGV